MNDGSTKDPSRIAISPSTADEKPREGARNVDPRPNVLALSKPEDESKELPESRNGGKATESDKPKKASETTGLIDAKETRESKVAENGIPDGDTKSDSEAETIVLSGKEDGSNKSSRKSIKHEGKDVVEIISKDEASDGLGERPHRVEDANVSPKRKRSSKDLGTTTGAETNYSSNLSSTISSPTRDADSSSRVGSESAHSSHEHSKVIKNGDSHNKDDLPSRKRKVRTEDVDEKHQQAVKKRGTSSETTHSHRREDRRKTSTVRSESPPTRPRNRAASTQSIVSPNVHRRRKPPPLQVNRQKLLEDISGESDDSGSAHGSTSRSKMASTDNLAMSPAKLPHKKVKDKNGRTLLARACAADEIEAVKARLKERPGDLDVSDNADNTPLQIASLEGNAEIVEILLKAGCEVACQNVDQDTPLIDAVENGHLDVVKLLLAYGADPRQRNSDGEEPIDLVNPENENYHAIKAALAAAREKNRRRRSSDDPHAPLNTGRDSISAPSPRESPSLHGAKSPPPSGAVSRRRTARSEVTRNDLLWVNPTADSLRKHAAKGDVEGVDHILQMKPINDIEAVIAAAKGGHEVVLQLLIAMGRPEHDPEPLSHLKVGFNTPMLAAIGKGKPGIIRLLLEQSDFNPTRRLYRNLSYHELAKERSGPGWSEEYRLLKDAYNKHAQKHNGILASKGRSGTSPGDQKKSKTEPSPSSPRGSLKRQSLDSISKDEPKKRRIIEERNGKGREGEKADRSQEKLRKHLRVPPKEESRESSAIVSDREISPLQPQKANKPKRSLSDGTAEVEAPKPRKRLISGKDKSDQERKRRASLVSVTSSSSGHDQRQAKSTQTKGLVTVKREDTKDETKTPIHETAKKRPRRSVTPSESESRRTSEGLKKSKRPRFDQQGKGIDKDSSKSQLGPARVANMVPSSNSMSAPPPPGAAPVAFMGSSNGSVLTKESSISVRSSKKSPGVDSDENIRRKKRESPRPQDSQKLKKCSPAPDQPKKRLASEAGREEVSAAEIVKRRQRELDLLEQQAKEKAAAEEAERLAQEQERHRLAEQRRAEEAEKKARLEREEEEAHEEKRRKEEEKKQKEEEQLKLQAERERQRKEEQERQIQRRAEQEERDRLARIKKQQDEERRRRDSLPNSLRRAAELSSEDAKQPNEIAKWLPLYTATGGRLDPSCDEPAREERWITNIQAAPILGIKDLDLSQYTAWTKLPVSENQRISLWRVLRLKLAQYEPALNDRYSVKADLELDALTRTKFFALEHVFWIKLSDFMDIIQRFPHLGGVNLTFASLALPLKNGLHVNGVCSTKTTNGMHPPPITNGTLTNGFH